MSAISPEARQVALIVAATFFIQLLDGVIIVTAIPSMARDFDVEPLTMSAGVTVYMLTTAIFIPMAGWLADRFGARRMFLLAIAGFTLASLACGLSQTLWQFIVSRGLQGIGGALMVPIGRVIVLRNARKSEIVDAMALITWPALIAPVIGPALGGFLTTYASWQANFLINIPLGAAAVGLVWRLVPDDGENKRTPFDIVGFVLSAGGLVLLLYGLEAGVQGTLPLLVAALFAGAGLALGSVAVWWLRRTPHPLISLAAFGIPTFAISNLLAGTYFRVAINATPFLLPLMFQIGFGLDPLEAGGLVIAYFVGNLAMKSVTTPVLRRFGFRTVLLVNGFLGAASLAACALLSPDMSLPLLLAILLGAGLTRSMQFTSLNTLAFADVEAAERSSASTLSTMLQQISMVLGVVVAAGLLSLSQMSSGRPTLTLGDFHMAFIGIAVIAAVASVQMFRLAPDAGEEVSGHHARAG